MQSPRNPSRKAPKFFDTKILIATLSLAVTVGTWNLLSHNAYEADKAKTAQAKGSLTPAPPTELADDIPVIPTVMPLIAIQSIQTGNDAATVKAETQSTGQTQQLRSVAAPTQVIVQRSKPVVVQPVQIVNVGGGGGGGGGSAAPAPVTSTRSSR